MKNKKNCIERIKKLEEEVEVLKDFKQKMLSLDLKDLWRYIKRISGPFWWF